MTDKLAMKKSLNIILIFSLFLSCSPKKDKPSSLIVITNPPAEVGGGGESSSDNSGNTPVDSISDNEDEQVPSIDDIEANLESTTITNIPFYKTFQKSKSENSKFNVQIGFLQKPSELSVVSIELNGQPVSIDQAILEKRLSFEVELSAPIKLEHFKIQFNKEVEANTLWFLEIFAVQDSLQRLYRALYLNDIRSGIAGQSELSFIANVSPCTQGRKMNQEGVCQYYPFYCSDVLPNPDKSQHCLIKRDDNKVVHCYAVSDNNECQQKVNAVCQDVVRFVQYPNQMFWGEISGQMISNRQCQ
jgi:hypothetical protein